MILQMWGVIVAQILLGSYFVITGARDIRQIEQGRQLLIAKHLPLPTVLYITGVLIKLIAGALVMLGFFVTYAATVLALFTLIATIIFCNFWRKHDKERVYALNSFLVHMSVIGGLLLAALF